METCIVCGNMTAERNHYTGLLKCYKKDCGYEEVTKKCIVIDMDGSLVNLDNTLLTRVSEALKFDFTKVDAKIFSYEEMITKYIPVTKQQ
jgi:hypothetical protein